MLLGLLLCGFSVNAGTVIVSHGTVSGANDADQAGPIWGMGVTPAIGVESGQVKGPMYLSRMEFQSSSTGTGNGKLQGNLFLHVYDDFEVNGQGQIVKIGNLVTASRTSLNASSFGKNQTLTWDFDGLVSLDPQRKYAFVMSSDRHKEATVEDHEHLVPGAFELNSKDPYTGGDSYTARRKHQGWDLEFRASFQQEASPVKKPSVLLAIGGMTLVLDDSLEGK